MKFIKIKTFDQRRTQPDSSFTSDVNHFISNISAEDIVSIDWKYGDSYCRITYKKDKLPKHER